MATKKVKGKKAKKTAAKSKAPRTKGDSRPRETIANFIREKLEKAGKDFDAGKIAEAAKAAFPKKNPTPGYVNWISKHAKTVSTTTAAVEV